MPGKKVARVIPDEILTQKIYVVRGKKVMLDRDLAGLYGVETRVLNQAVSRNKKRFPNDFMFLLTTQEVAAVRSQSVTSKQGRGGTRYAPKAFTEQGVSMLSSVLNSDRAIEVNIQIMRLFAKLREMLSSHAELLRRMEKVEKSLVKQDEEIQVVFKAIKQLLMVPEKPKKQIGFHPKKK